MSSESTARVLKIAVGTKNPCKIDAVKEAIQQSIQTSAQVEVEIRVEGFPVESGVADQPFGDVSRM